MTVAGNLGINYSFKNNDKIIAYVKNTSSYILSAKNIDTTIYKDVKTLAFGMAYKTQNLNYIYNPSKGYYFLTDIASGNRNFNNTSTKHLELNINFDFYFPIYQKFIYKLSSQNKYLISKDDFFQNELYKVGGFNSVRGFDEDAFFTQSFSVLTNEIRFLYEKKSNVYIFSDIARVESLNDNSLLYGFGFGTNFSTKAGIFSISYALGKTDNNPIQISNSKIHLGYINRF
jgi:hemolysin activation/secretion protein